MKAYLISLAVGLLAGGLYGLLSVKSPAPPVIALVGLLGMLIGEQTVPKARQLIAGRALFASPNSSAGHKLGGLPSDHSSKQSHRDDA
jgi:XapX domain-containing protein